MFLIRSDTFDTFLTDPVFLILISSNMFMYVVGFVGCLYVQGEAWFKAPCFQKGSILAYIPYINLDMSHWMLTKFDLHLY